MYNSPETKLRTLASQNATLQADLGTNPFRWFDRQLPQQIAPGVNFAPGLTCVRVLCVSTRWMQNQSGTMTLSQPLLQIEVLDYDPEVARSVANDIRQFMATVDLCSTAQFSSPVTSPPQAPCFLVNQRARMDYQLQPPAYVENMDFRLFNREDL
jgi:hypothetical protein